MPAIENGQGPITEKLIIVVFGASGDVAKKMSYPALFALFKHSLLPPSTQIIGYARSDLSSTKFEEQITGTNKEHGHKREKEDQEVVQRWKECNRYVRGKYDEDAGYENLEKELQSIADDKFGGESHRMYYLALPPSQFTLVSEKIKKHNHTGITNRLVIEKPFGKDTESCQTMMSSILSNWTEPEIYRIDHFLGEEMVRNIQVLRFANENLMEPFMNKERVGAVVVELLEEFGVKGRGGYFDEFGLIRDIHQNHLLQVALALAIEKPKSLSGDEVRDEKIKVLNAIRPIDPKDSVSGQYVKSDNGNEEEEGYLEHEDVENKKSKTETFSSVVFYVDTHRWKGVPWILKSGKALNKSLCRATIQLKPAEKPLFGDENNKATEFRIEMIPEERAYFSVQTKVPGPEHKITTAQMTLDYEKAFPKERVPDAYETVMRAVVEGDQTMFVREDELIASWKIFSPLLHYLEGNESPRPIDYKYGSMGPKEATDLEERVGVVHRE